VRHAGAQRLEAGLGRERRVGAAQALDLDGGSLAYTLSPAKTKKSGRSASAACHTGCGRVWSAHDAAPMRKRAVVAEAPDARPASAAVPSASTPRRATPRVMRTR
jgi:hypothetical protein